MKDLAKSHSVETSPENLDFSDKNFTIVFDD